MGNKDLKLTPHDITSSQWWYEEPQGISVVARLKDKDGKYLGTLTTLIGWRALRGALKRKDN